MLRTFEQLLGLEIIGKDGSVGSLEDVFFDQDAWRLRHAVVFAGEWLSGRWLVLPVSLFRGIDPARRLLRVAATRDRIGAAPSPETDRPISCIFETALYSHYGCEPCGLPSDAAGAEADRSRLLSAVGMKGYRVEARDGEVGRLEDYFVGDEEWDIRYLSVATRRWLPGRRVAAPSAWIRLIDLRHKRIALRRFRDEIKQAPGYEGPGMLSAGYSEALDTYFANAGMGPWITPYP